MVRNVKCTKTGTICQKINGVLWETLKGTEMDVKKIVLKRLN